MAAGRDLPDALSACPDLTTFTRLDEPGLGAMPLNLSRSSPKSIFVAGVACRVILTSTDTPPPRQRTRLAIRCKRAGQSPNRRIGQAASGLAADPAHGEAAAQPPVRKTGPGPARSATYGR